MCCASAVMGALASISNGLRLARVTMAAKAAKKKAVKTAPKKTVKKATKKKATKKK